MLNENQLERYSRHIIMSEVGVEGQQKLIDSKVLVIGTGGLGAPAAMFLAAAGVGTIGLVDGDKVELSNLQRQIIHQTEDVGKDKTVSGEETINKMNPDVNVVVHNTWINSSNILDIFNSQDYDFIIDGTDNFSAKFLINDACVLAKKPYVHAGIISFAGQLITYIPDRNAPCYRCLFKEPPPEGTIPSCREAGVLGVMGGVIGTLQATEAIKYLIGKGDNLTGELLAYDALTMDFRKIALKRNQNCVLCGDKPQITELFDYSPPSCNV